MKRKTVKNLFCSLLLVLAVTTFVQIAGASASGGSSPGIIYWNGSDTDCLGGTTACAVVTPGDYQ